MCIFSFVGTEMRLLKSIKSCFTFQTVYDIVVAVCLFWSVSLCYAFMSRATSHQRSNSYQGDHFVRYKSLSTVLHTQNKYDIVCQLYLGVKKRGCTIQPERETIKGFIMVAYKWKSRYGAQ